MWKSHKPRFPHFHSAGDDSPFLLTKQPRCALRALAQQLIKGASANRTLCRALPYSGSSRIGINFPFRAHFALESLLTFRLICGLENAVVALQLDHPLGLADWSNVICCVSEVVPTFKNFFVKTTFFEFAGRWDTEIRPVGVVHAGILLGSYQTNRIYG